MVRVFTVGVLAVLGVLASVAVAAAQSQAESLCSSYAQLVERLVDPEEGSTLVGFCLLLADDGVIAPEEWDLLFAATQRSAPAPRLVPRQAPPVGLLQARRGMSGRKRAGVVLVAAGAGATVLSYMLGEHFSASGRVGRTEFNISAGDWWIPPLRWGGVAAAGIGGVLLLYPEPYTAPRVSVAPGGWSVTKTLSW